MRWLCRTAQRGRHENRGLECVAWYNGHQFSCAGCAGGVYIGKTTNSRFLWQSAHRADAVTMSRRLLRLIPAVNVEKKILGLVQPRRRVDVCERQSIAGQETGEQVWTARRLKPIDSGRSSRWVSVTP